MLSFALASRFSQDCTLRGDHRHQVVPGFDERLGPFVLKLGGQSIDINAGLGKLAQHFLAVAAIRKQDRADFAVISKSIVFTVNGAARALM